VVKVRENKVMEATGLNMMQLQGIAETICARALERARPPTSFIKDKPGLEELLQDPTFVQRFKVGLARGAADLLAANDNRVYSVYLLEASAALPMRLDASSSSTPNIHLLVVVEQRSAALHALATALDQALIREVRKFPASALLEDKSLINPLFITEKEVAQHKGYAMLLSSAHRPLLTIWKRKEH
jgi:hypothetical protein